MSNTSHYPLNHLNNSNKTLCAKPEMRKGDREAEALFSDNYMPLITQCFAFEPIFANISFYVWPRIITYFPTKQIISRLEIYVLQLLDCFSLKNTQSK